MRNGQNGRRRGRGGPPRAPSGGRSPDMGNRNEVRVRGNAHQLLEKYKQLARDASMQGDRVTAEYYMQYADHYYRVLNEFRARQEEQQARFQQHNNNNRQRDYEDGDDDGDEIEGAEPIRVSEMTRTIPEAQHDPRGGGEDRHDDDSQIETRGDRDDGRREEGRRGDGRRDGGRRNAGRDSETGRSAETGRNGEDQGNADAEATAGPADGEEEAPRRRRGRPRRPRAEGADELAPVEA